MGSVRREKVEDCDEGLITNCLIGSVRKGETVGLISKWLLASVTNLSFGSAYKTFSLLP